MDVKDFYILYNNTKCKDLGLLEREHIAIIFTNMLGINVKR
jgi:hypothetical protein